MGERFFIAGIGGSAAARRMADNDFKMFRLARRPRPEPDVSPVPADFLQAALQDVRPAIVVIATWLRQESEAENIRVNAGLVRNLLDALRPLGSVRRVALATGLKHDLGPFEAYSSGNLPDTPFREDQDQLDVPNFCYAQADELFAAAERNGFAWSVHRPHTIVGFAVGNALNVGTTLAAYATICRETGRPFRFPGSPVQWQRLSDLTDARQLAPHIHWAAITPDAANEAFDVVNGDVIRWRWLWPRIAAWFGVEAERFDGTIEPLEPQMAQDGPLWREIAERHGLAELDLTRLAPAWNTDGDLGRPIEVVTDMSKSRRLGFTTCQPTDDAFFDLFERLRRERLIP